MDDKTWEKMVKVVAPGIRKMKVSNVACVFPVHTLWYFYSFFSLISIAFGLKLIPF